MGQVVEKNNCIKKKPLEKETLLISPKVNELMCCGKRDVDRIDKQNKMVNILKSMDGVESVFL